MAPMHEESCIEDPSIFWVSLPCCQLVSSSIDCFPCLDARTLWLKFESPFPTVIFMIHAGCERCFWSLRLLHSLHLLPHHLSHHLAVPAAWQLTSSTSWINTLRTSAEDFGTRAENNSSAPGDHQPKIWGIGLRKRQSGKSDTDLGKLQKKEYHQAHNLINEMHWEEFQRDARSPCKRS